MHASAVRNNDSWGLFMERTVPKVAGQNPAIDRICTLARTFWDDPPGLMAELEHAPAHSVSTPSAIQPVKRVLIYFDQLGIGGGENVTRQLSLLWRSMGIEVTILSDPPRSGSDASPIVPQGVRHINLPDAYQSREAIYRQRADALERAITTTEADAIVFAHWFVPSLPFDLLVARSHGLKSFICVQSPFSMFFRDPYPPSAILVPHTYSLADAVICLSEADRTVWSRFNPNTRVMNNPLCIPTPTVPAKLEGHRIIWPARMHPDKHPERVIPIMQELIKLVPDAKLDMVGPVEETYRSHFSNLLAQADLTESVLIHGPQPLSDMPHWYARSDAFLLTSDREGWSLVLNEALATGLPCVIYDLPYLTLVRNNPGIQAIPQGNYKMAANKLAHVLLDKTAAHAYGSAGRQFAQHIATFDHTGFWRELFETPRRRQLSSSESHDELTSLDKTVIEEFFSARAAFARSVGSQQDETLRELQRLHTIAGQQQARIAKLEQTCAERAEACEHLHRDLENTRGSFSFKIGRAITLLPRKMRRLLLAR